MKLVLLGPPGAGKGTQAEKISEKYNIPAISTGHIIRNAIADKTPVGVEAKTYIDRGELVPDSMVIKMVEERLMEDDCGNGYILDGFPRTVSQAEAMETLPIPIDMVLEISVDEDVVVDRLSGRRECSVCGATYHVKANPPKEENVCDKCSGQLVLREDDVPDVIRNRISVYKKQTEPLKEYYEKKGLLVSVIGRKKVENTTKDVIEAIDKKMSE